MHPTRLPPHEAAIATRRANHQQRLDFGERPPPQLGALHRRQKHTITGLTKSTSLDGRAHDIACGQIDIGNAATEMTAAMHTTGVPQADGRIDLEPTFDVADVARAIVFMATLPLDANVQFMTVMATKMPYIGHG